MAFSETNALELSGVCKAYGDFRLEQVSFTLPSGSIMGFIGENGAGKTTTLKAILNLIHLDSGSIRILGKDSVREGEAVRNLYLTGPTNVVCEGRVTDEELGTKG